ncbi:MAG: hypothetical protein ABI321_05550 [Polyangia bacterium]
MSGIDLLAERIGTIPAMLTMAVAIPLPDGIERLAAMDRVVVTGGGMSEGPARVLVALLLRAGRHATFVSQSRFVDWPEPPAPRTALVLFSQGLAPNARLPLPYARGFGTSLLVTSVSEAGGVAMVWTLPPACEDRLLLRVVGPSVALCAAVRIAHAVTGRSEDLSVLPGVVARRLAEPAPDLFGASRRPLALVVDDRLIDVAMPLRWKLLEGLRVNDPPVWDVLQVAHGPLQSFYEHETTLLVVRGAPARHAGLYDGLRSVLVPGRHRVVELDATLEGDAAIVELDVALDAALLATLRHHPVTLDDWPSRGLDGPLYDVRPKT